MYSLQWNVGFVRSMLALRDSYVKKYVVYATAARLFFFPFNCTFYANGFVAHKANRVAFFEKVSGVNYVQISQKYFVDQLDVINSCIRRFGNIQH